MSNNDSSRGVCSRPSSHCESLPLQYYKQVCEAAAWEKDRNNGKKKKETDAELNGNNRKQHKKEKKPQKEKKH